MFAEHDGCTKRTDKDERLTIPVALSSITALNTLVTKLPPIRTLIQ